LVVGVIVCPRIGPVVPDWIAAETAPGAGADFQPCEPDGIPGPAVGAVADDAVRVLYAGSATGSSSRAGMGKVPWYFPTSAPADSRPSGWSSVLAWDNGAASTCHTTAPTRWLASFQRKVLVWGVVSLVTSVDHVSEPIGPLAAISRVRALACPKMRSAVPSLVTVIVASANFVAVLSCWRHTSRRSFSVFLGVKTSGR